ncbi:hypothetical protein FPANT_2426 [Fusarium pseudoanthophilum]|uniref:Uncharacterized protein n=1 Tax=Fusarium pseudoanthophilum TaxID=48495 RepID=A0A8H5PQI2_9HYPO|nr:hypothetical protein FPANT_2426 [Fusarium pseudoanthophilum]
MPCNGNPFTPPPTSLELRTCRSAAKSQETESSLDRADFLSGSVGASKSSARELISETAELGGSRVRFNPEEAIWDADQAESKQYSCRHHKAPQKKRLEALRLSWNAADDLRGHDFPVPLGIGRRRDGYQELRIETSPRASKSTVASAR